MRRTPAIVAACVLASTAAVCLAQDEGPPVRCLRAGLGEEVGALAALADGAVTLTRDGAAFDYPLAAFREVVINAPVDSPYPPPLAIWTADDDRWLVRAIGQAEREGSVDVTGYGWRAQNVSLLGLGAVATRRTLLAGGEDAAELDRLRAEPPTGSDRVMVVRDEERRAVPCVVQGIGNEGVRVTAGGTEHTVPWDRCAWVVLADAPHRDPTRLHAVELRDGTRLRAGDLRLEGGTLTGRDGAATFTVEARQLAKVVVASDAFAYLSDLTPAGVATEPLIDVVWRPRVDRCVAGGPLTLDGRTYGKGIGMHTRTAMAFALDGAYAQFHATVGIDDASGGLGEATFRVLGDGRELASTGPLRGGDAPRELSADVAGVAELVLMADFGGGAVASGNFADWADARVVK